MTKETDWIVKIIALLHDPPGKTLGLAGHQRRAFELMEQVIGADEFQRRFGGSASTLTRRDFEVTQEGALIKEADRLASAIDRAAFPHETRLGSDDFKRNLQVRHPFSGCALPLSTNEGPDSSIAEDILHFVSSQADARKKYLALWRTLPLLSADRTTRLLPSDTRILDHTLWAHLDVSSGLVSALPEVAMLQVSVGPVQTFIFEARRTQDLWMGSYLLSFLAWSGIQVIAETYGPDSIIYPSLRGHPWMDRWLREELGSLPAGVFTGDITIASTPNKFVAFVPAQDVEDIANKVIQTVQYTWREIAEAVRKDFPGGPRGGIWETIWRRQVEREDWPQIHWSAVLWPDTTKYPTGQGAEEALRQVEACLGRQSIHLERLDLYKRSWKQGTNVGTMYAPLYELLGTALDARKRSRDFLQAEEDGEKCTISPSFSALRTAERQRREQVRQYWSEVAAVLKGQGRAHELAEDGRERLSAIAAVKRLAQRAYFEQHGVRLYFPSTSRVAAVPFYRTVFQKLSGDDVPVQQELQQKLRDHPEALGRLNYPRVSVEAARKALPRLRRELEQVPAGLQEYAEALLRYDADVLYPERLDPRLLAREHQLQNRQAAREAQRTCRALRQAVEMSPPTYYAVLLIDGDDMGKWLSGKHERMPSFRQVMHPDVLPKFGNLPNAADWRDTLDQPRPPAANLHASLSAALSTFAWRCVRWVVEEGHCGRVVYAGGDDVMALLPLAEAISATHELHALFRPGAGRRPVASCAAISAARELYALFTGHAEVKDGELKIKADSNGFLAWEDEIFLVPGPDITLSAGIAVVHHIHPLDAALQAARAAQRLAKQVEGKAAMAVRVIKRSGETVTMRSKWNSLGGLFDELVAHFAQKRLSSRFAYDLSSRAHIVTALEADARRATLKQLVGRHKTDQLQDPDRLIQSLANWAQALDGQTPPEKVDGADVLQGMAELARWVVFARFVAQGGSE